MEFRPITRNIVTVGNAAGVTIPKSIIELLGLEVGDEIAIRISKVPKTENKLQGEGFEPTIYEILTDIHAQGGTPIYRKQQGTPILIEVAAE